MLEVVEVDEEEEPGCAWCGEPLGFMFVEVEEDGILKPYCCTECLLAAT